jgi:hypothetical protein
MAIPLAHLGHWYVGGPVFLSPVIAVLALMWFGRWRDRRRGVPEVVPRVEVTGGAATRLVPRGPLDWTALFQLEMTLDELPRSVASLTLDLGEATELGPKEARRLAELLEVASLRREVTVAVASEAQAEALRAAGVPAEIPAGRPA